MKQLDKLALDYSQNPKNCMSGFVPMGRTDDAFRAGFRKAKQMLREMEPSEKRTWFEIPMSALEELGESEVG